MIDGKKAVGVWSHLDSAALRRSIQAAGWDGLPVVYLDSPETPDIYRATRVIGFPVPLEVLRAMDAAFDQAPWEVRDRMLAGMRIFDSMEAYEADLKRQGLACFANKEAPPPPDTEPSVDWRAVQIGHTVFTHWKRWDPVAAEADRAGHKDETAYLIGLGKGEP